jgi:hypothetical protein
VPNYTTNGTELTKKILEATQKFCGGVAVSCHTHLEKYWHDAIFNLADLGTQVNVHIIISDKESVDYFKEVYNNYDRTVAYFVLLPYISQGRATEKEVCYDYLTKTLDSMALGQVAFGAGFYEYLQGKDYPVSLYEPELMSGYLDAKDLNLYKSSFDLTLKEVKRC